MSEIIYGIHAVKSLLHRDARRFLKVFILQGRNDSRFKQLITELKEIGVSIQTTHRWWLDKKVNCALHQGVIAQVRARQKTQVNNLQSLLKNINTPFLLVLDGVTDPHNLGACLRTADAAGVHAVIVPRDRSAQLNDTAKKVACGSAENVQLIRVTNLARTLRLLHEMNVKVIGAASEVSDNLYQSKMTGAIALVMGSEGKGLRRLTRECCDEFIRIPMTGITNSLNISVATGVCLFEAIRQRFFSSCLESAKKL